MIRDDKVFQILMFLLSSVKKLSESFVESEDKLMRTFETAANVDNLQKRMECLERQLVELSDGVLKMGRVAVEPELPVLQGTRDLIVPRLNLTLDAILEVYANTPLLLEPFSRPCSLSGRTFSGEIDEVELEVSAHGSAWVIETLDGGWLLLPRPGSLERRAQLYSLERLYEIEGDRHLPAILHLICPAQLDAIVFGRRWQLREKGVLSMNPDPLKAGTSERLAELEHRLALLESRGNT